MGGIARDGRGCEHEDDGQAGAQNVERDLGVFLARHAGRVLTHKQILTAVWGPAHTEDTQYLRVYVGQLRQKIEDKPDDPQIVLTEPGIGYRVAEG
jgi:two-component system KDP operon response regulator KdpE